VFIASFVTDKTTWDVEKNTYVNFVACSSISDISFQENLNDRHYLDNYLCPESGEIYYNGVAGTQLWVVPKNNSDTFDIRTDVTPYLRN
jgi:hypothetical protein